MNKSTQIKRRIAMSAAVSAVVGVAEFGLISAICYGAEGLSNTAWAAIAVVSSVSSVALCVALLKSAWVAHELATFSDRERRFEGLVENSSDVLVVVNTDKEIIYASPSTRHIYGVGPDELIGESLDALVAANDRARVRSLFAMAGIQDSGVITAEWRATRSDGDERHVEVLLRNLSEEKSIGGTVLNIRDVTDRKELQEQLAHQAMHDDLTGLPNRVYLRSRIEAALSKYLFQGEVFSLLVIDLDDFKNVNDSFGHVSGDAVIKTLTSRLKGCLRRDDLLVRLGGDEFALLLPNLSGNDDEISQLFARVIDQVTQVMDIENRQLTMSASLGFACVSDLVIQAEDLLRNADLALHTAKATKRGFGVKFEASMRDAAMRRAEMVSDLRGALERDELQLYFQPTVDLPTGRFEGVEALLRWPHPERGFVSPADFIPVAEEAGLIVPMGTWVLEQACAQMAQWQARYPTDEPLVMNVNFSGRQLAEPDVVDTVARVIEQSGILPGTLVLEMTESVLMDDQPATLARMEALRSLGVELAIDDFGTGYSSLSYLRQFPITVLKIDRAFIQGLGSELRKDDAALVQAIVDLAGNLKMRTIAEGIETPDQLALLRSMGCDVGQGFLLARPAPAEDVRRLIAKSVGANAPLDSAAPTEDTQTIG